MFATYKRYADFRGRSNRSEYWLFFLWVIILYVVAAVVDIILFNGLSNIDTFGGITGPTYVLVALANIIPSIAVGFRRLHDTNRSAWWILIGIIPLIGGLVLLVFYVLPGTPEANRFGPPPGGDVGTTFD